MSLYKNIIVTKLLKENEVVEVVQFSGYRKAKREALRCMDDVKSNIFGASFELVDGTFLKEIHI